MLSLENKKYIYGHYGTIYDWGLFNYGKYDHVSIE